MNVTLKNCVVLTLAEITQLIRPHKEQKKSIFMTATGFTDIPIVENFYSFIYFLSNRKTKKIMFLLKHSPFATLERFSVLIIISEPSPIATLEKFSKRVQRCDVKMLASNSLQYFRLFLNSLLILS